MKNCGTIELMIITEKAKEVIGTAHVDVSMICECKLISQFVPIMNDSGNKLGELRVSLQLRYFPKFQSIPLKICKYNKEQDNDIVLSTIDNLRDATDAVSCKNLDSVKESSMKPAKINIHDTYRSVLKAKRPKFQECKRKHNEVLTDKLITQIVARAQRLRGAILKETYNDDPLALSDSSMSNELYPTVKNEANLYNYILGKEMTVSEEKKALDTLQLTSPTSSLIDLASKPITIRENKNEMDTKRNENFPVKWNDPIKDILRK